MTGSKFALQDYGIALQSGSPLREPINQTLLALMEDGVYRDLMHKYFRE